MTNHTPDAVGEALEYDWDAAHEALESMDDYARMDVGVAPHGPYTVLRDLLTKAKGWKEQADRHAALAGAEPVGEVVAVPRVPTQAMVDAFSDPDIPGDDVWVRECWAAMIEAAPHAPAKAREEWQPIATAPKDGTRILAFAGSRPFIARHGRTVGWWDDNDLMRDPTHWQPLPDAAALATFAEGE